ncbi:ubiquitin-like domain-containing protein [Streptomyces apocyni]|uniref:ubiquitin-like domain-containing protein n=1 Tax=Streptomyces apocyni TaxID=2654677 RepID=UPI002D7F7FD3|nr:ubiquitin-like domain-containing protein [Streptomyces apocyni]
MSNPQGSHRAARGGGGRRAATVEPSRPRVPYADTYRPAYESAGSAESAESAGSDEYAYASAPTEPMLPRQVPASEPPSPLTTPPPDAPRLSRAEARRVARRKKAIGRPRPESLRRLVPQALVVAFLAGGTSVFIAEDKAVSLSVDGERPRKLHTFAGDVGELIAKEGVEVGAHDRVIPAPGAALADGDEVVVRYGRPLDLTVDGQRRQEWTTARTVGGALRELDVRAEGAHLSTSLTRRISRSGLRLDVRTERTFTVMADGRERTIRTNVATVREAVEQAGVTLSGQDTTSVPPSSFPRDGQTVSVMRITATREVREEPIPFAVRRTADASRYRGTEVVEQQGRPGARRLVHSVRTVNGVKQKPKLLRSEVVREPRTQIVRFGTKARPAPVQGVAGADGLDWGALAACESGGRPGATDPSGTYGGLYQFDVQTWQSLGGSGRPQDAPAAEQTYRAKKLYVQRGAGPWPHCGRRLQG